MNSIGGRDVFLSETFLLSEGEKAYFETNARSSPLRVEVFAVAAPGKPAAQAILTLTPPTILQAGAGPLVSIKLENWDYTNPAAFLRPARFGQLPDGTPLGYTVMVTAISAASTVRIIHLEMYVGGSY